MNHCSAEDECARPPQDEHTSAIREAFDGYFRIEPAPSGPLRDEVHRLRYQVYCVEHGFEDPAQHPNREERDEYDACSVHALIRHLESNDCAAVVRLVLAGSCIAQELPIFTHCGHALYPGARERVARVPQGQLAEISRLAVSRAFKRRLAEAETVSGVSAQATYSDADTVRDGAHNRGFPHITVGLFAAIVQMSAEQGITHWLAVMEPTLLRLLRRFGIRFERIGHDVDYHGRRRPTLGVAADVVDGILAERPDIWDLVTQGGHYLPPRA